MQAITITLNGIEVSGHPGMTILDLAKESGVKIPTLCHDSHLNPYGACRICLVEDERNGALLASCVAPIASGMVINTNSEKVLESRRTIVKLMLASHPDTCMVCDKGNRCSLRQIAADLGIGRIDLQRIPHAAVIGEVNPFIERDLSKCIMCAKCIRADQELVVQGAIDFMNRGFTSHPATLGDLPLELSNCTFCGTCVALCPTGALVESNRVLSGTATKVVSTVCSYCGCGCNLDLEVSGNKVVRVRPGDENSPNGVTVCARGTFGFDYVHSPDRLTQPLMKADGEFQPVSWDEALEVIAAEFNRIKAENGSDSLGVYGSSKCTNEDNYVLQKFAREVLGTKNIDSGGSLYNLAVRNNMKNIFGLPASTNTIEDIERSGVILLVDADPEIINPIVGYAIKRAVKYKGAKLIVIGKQPANLINFATLWLQPNDGRIGNLINGLIKTIADNKWFVAGKIPQNAATLFESLSYFTQDQVEGITGVSSKNQMDAARILSETDGVAIIHGTENPDGGQSVVALANLALLTGRVGDMPGGFFTLQKENNAQGASDMGCLPNYLPGYVSIQNGSGATVFEMFENAKAGKIKGMYIVGENPAAGFADNKMIEESLSALDFLVVQDLFLTETAKLANVVLPAASFAEKDGTFTSFERRIQRIRKAVDPRGESLPDWQIVQKLATAMQHSMNYPSAEAIMDEVSRTTGIYEGISYARLESGGMYWPASAGDRVGKQRLYHDGFPEGFGQFSINQSDVDNSQKIALKESTTLYEFGSGARSSRSRRLSAMIPGHKLMDD